MNKSKMNYFEEEDILHIIISSDIEFSSVELSPNITAELNEQGDLIGVEIINASAYIRDGIIESIQGKLLNLSSKKVASS
ncbi:MAG: DUF2283 domain-containing protein [Candidatus Competibacteraceae bacterium]|nr:DUF2283 domain-containing protein [Candidatus Competibacteraceae bacterium]